MNKFLKKGVARELGPVTTDTIIRNLWAQSLAAFLSFFFYLWRHHSLHIRGAIK